jgi:hypothetical protein
MTEEELRLDEDSQEQHDDASGEIGNPEPATEAAGEVLEQAGVEVQASDEDSGDRPSDTAGSDSSKLDYAMPEARDPSGWVDEDTAMDMAYAGKRGMDQTVASNHVANTIEDLDVPTHPFDDRKRRQVGEADNKVGYAITKEREVWRGRHRSGPTEIREESNEARAIMDAMIKDPENGGRDYVEKYRNRARSGREGARVRMEWAEFLHNAENRPSATYEKEVLGHEFTPEDGARLEFTVRQELGWAEDFENRVANMRKEHEAAIKEYEEKIKELSSDEAAELHDPAPDLMREVRLQVRKYVGNDPNLRQDWHDLDKNYLSTDESRLHFYDGLCKERARGRRNSAARAQKILDEIKSGDAAKYQGKQSEETTAS